MLIFVLFLLCSFCFVLSMLIFVSFLLSSFLYLFVAGDWVWESFSDDVVLFSAGLHGWSTQGLSRVQRRLAHVYAPPRAGWGRTDGVVLCTVQRARAGVSQYITAQPWRVHLTSDSPCSDGAPSLRAAPHDRAFAALPPAPAPGSFICPSATLLVTRWWRSHDGATAPVPPLSSSGWEAAGGPLSAGGSVSFSRGTASHAAGWWSMEPP